MSEGDYYKCTLVVSLSFKFSLQLFTIIIILISFPNKDIRRALLKVKTLFLIRFVKRYNEHLFSTVPFRKLGSSDAKECLEEIRSAITLRNNTSERNPR